MPRLPSTVGHSVYIRLNPKDEMSILDVCEKIGVPDIRGQSFSQLVKIAIETLLVVARRDAIIPEPDTFQYANRVLSVYFNDTGTNKLIRADRLAKSKQWLVDQSTYQAADREQINPPQDMTTVSPEEHAENIALQREFKDLHARVQRGLELPDDDVTRYVDLQVIGKERNWNMQALKHDALKP